MSRAPRAASKERDARLEIMEVAERLCGEHGLESVSVRDIAQEAGVSLSAINYHFGSKSNLLRTILRTRLDDIHAERESLLTQLEATKTPDLRDILRALLGPLAKWRAPDSGRQAALQFMARALITSMPELKEEVDESVPKLRRITSLLQQALPHLSREEVCWRLHFTMGVEHMNHWDAHRLGILSEGKCDTSDTEAVLAKAIDYAAAAFHAPDAARGKAESRPAKRARKG
jgi:AcrR family transcriptional regulator